MAYSVTGPTGPAGPVDGSTGATDNQLLRSDGVGGALLQSTAITVNDSNQMSGQANRPVQASGPGPLDSTVSGSTVRPAAGGGELEAFLPAVPVIGDHYFFVCVIATDQITVRADGAQVIYIGASPSSAGGTAISTTKGSMLRLEYVATDLWFGIASGTWVLA